MREVDELDDPVDERVPQRDEGDERAVADPDEDRRDQELQTAGPPLEGNGPPEDRSEGPPIDVTPGC